MELYIMRHGETNWNFKGIIQGRSKNRLSKKGICQVENQSEKCRDICFDYIISSPLTRTIQTSNIMNKYHSVEILRDDRIIEIDQGVFSGRSKNTLTDEEKSIRERRLAEYGIESYDSVLSRVKDFLSYLKENFCDKSVLVVTHRSPASALYCLVKNENVTVEEIQNFDRFENAEIQYFHID